MTQSSRLRDFKTIPEIIRLAVILYVRFWWQRFDPMFASENRRRRIERMRSSRWHRHLDEGCLPAKKLDLFMTGALDFTLSANGTFDGPHRSITYLERMAGKGPNTLCLHAVEPISFRVSI